ncbi:MAG: hypothetical protein ACJAYV_000702 [Oleispira sp.]|jgi:hypothetical protein
MNLEIQAALEVADETDAFLQITDVIFNKKADIGYADLSPAEKSVYCIDSLSREMENGGFGQLFHHDSGALIQDMLKALEDIRAKNTYRIVRKIVDYFPDSDVPSDEDERMKVFDSLAAEKVDEIAECDDHFHDVGENLIELTLNFVAKNVNGFR